MKTKKITKKLTLTKETISHLEKGLLSRVNGGTGTLYITCNKLCFTEPVTGIPCEPCGLPTD